VHPLLDGTKGVSPFEREIGEPNPNWGFLQPRSCSACVDMYHPKACAPKRDPSAHGTRTCSVCCRHELVFRGLTSPSSKWDHIGAQVDTDGSGSADWEQNRCP
jgi:hypothetical protein